MKVTRGIWLCRPFVPFTSTKINAWFIQLHQSGLVVNYLAIYTNCVAQRIVRKNMTSCRNVSLYCNSRRCKQCRKLSVCMKSQQSANMYQSFDAVACYCGQGKQERMADDDLTALYFLQHPRTTSPLSGFAIAVLANHKFWVFLLCWFLP